jgi:hypothetical protein
MRFIAGRPGGNAVAIYAGLALTGNLRQDYRKQVAAVGA